MDLELFITAVFCGIDDFVRQYTTQHTLRQRGPEPTLADSEVLTIEVVGEFLGLDTDQGLHAYFRRHFAALFPRLATVHRTTFLRQAANLWGLKAALWQQLGTEAEQDAAVTLIDSLPVPVCRFARAHRCRLFAGCAAFGYDALAHQTFYGFRLHLRVAWPGVITGFALAPANAHDLTVAPQLLAGQHGWAVGDAAYWSPTLTAALVPQGLTLVARPRIAHAPAWPKWLVQTRRRIETIFSQLTERYHAKRVRARDPWHLAARWLRKVLSHTIAVLTCQRVGLSALRFAQLLTA